MKKILAYTLAIISFLPASVLAALGDGKLMENRKDDGSTETLVQFLGGIQSWLLGLIAGLAVLFIVYGGFLYITSGGNKERIETAKKTLTYSVLGLILVALAGVIFEILTGDFLTFIFGNINL